MHFKVFNVVLEKRKKTKLFIIILLNLQFERNTQKNKFSLRQIFSIVFQSATKFSLKILKIHLNFKAVKYCALTSSVAVCHPMANFDCYQQYFKQTRMMHDLRHYLFYNVFITLAILLFKS